MTTPHFVRSVAEFLELAARPHGLDCYIYTPSNLGAGGSRAEMTASYAPATGRVEILWRESGQRDSWAVGELNQQTHIPGAIGAGGLVAED